MVIWGESAGKPLLASFSSVFLRVNFTGAGSVLSHIIANDGKTNPPLFRGAISSSTYLPPIYSYNDSILEVSEHQF
jgi:hypothetical protein